MFYNVKRRIRRAASAFYRLTDERESRLSTTFRGPCPCCGGTQIVQKDILWDELVDIWGLSSEEKGYINRQQGLRCESCGARLRSMALAAWLCGYYKTELPLSELFDLPNACDSDVLEINEAGQLTQFLSKLPKHTLGCYPDVDIMNLPYANESFDLVVHSDTLEHVMDPVGALKECKRVLKMDGRCIFTVPVVVNRLTRSTARGLPSYHGHSGTRAEDFKVRTEFGADAWGIVIDSGFSECGIFSLEYPSALVFICKK